MKNYMDQFRVSVISGTDDYDGTAKKTLNGETDVKIKDNRLWDTSSSANAFHGRSVGDVVKMEGWDKAENNGIFVIADKESSGEWVRFDTPLLDQAEVESPGVTMYHTPITLTITGAIPGKIEILYGLNTDPLSAVAGSNFKVTAANTVASFADFNQDTITDGVVIFWADLSKG